MDKRTMLRIIRIIGIVAFIIETIPLAFQTGLYLNYLISEESYNQSWRVAIIWWFITGVILVVCEFIIKYGTKKSLNQIKPQHKDI